jgi:hypothetical protein
MTDKYYLCVMLSFYAFLAKNIKSRSYLTRVMKFRCVWKTKQMCYKMHPKQLVPWRVDAALNAVVNHSDWLMIVKYSWRSGLWWKILFYFIFICVYVVWTKKVSQTQTIRDLPHCLILITEIKTTWKSFTYLSSSLLSLTTFNYKVAQVGNTSCDCVAIPSK